MPSQMLASRLRVIVFYDVERLRSRLGSRLLRQAPAAALPIGYFALFGHAIFKIGSLIGARPFGAARGRIAYFAGRERLRS